MSALCQERTSPVTTPMSALTLKADIERHDWHVRFVPKAAHAPQQTRIVIRSRQRRTREARPALADREAGITSGNLQGIGDLFTALRRQGLIADELVLQLTTFLRSGAVQSMLARHCNEFARARNYLCLACRRAEPGWL